MKRKLFKRVISAAVCFIVLGIVLLAGGITPQAKAWASLDIYSEGESSEAAESKEVTPFLIDPALISTDETNVYVYDKMDRALKVLDKNTMQFRTSNYSLTLDEEPSELMVTSSSVLCFYKSSGQFVAYNKEDLTEKNVNSKVIGVDGEVKTISAISSSDKDYLLLCPMNPISGIFELMEVEAGDEITLTVTKRFKLGQSYTGLENYTNISTYIANGKLNLILSSSSSILAFEYDYLAQSEEIIVDTIDSSRDLALIITDFSLLKGMHYIECDLGDLIAFVYDNVSERKIEFYTADSTLTSKPDLKIVIEDGFSLDGVSSAKNTLAILSSTNQIVRVYNFQDTEGTISHSLSELKNPEIQDVYFTDKTIYGYYEIAEDCFMANKPYSKDSVVDIEASKHVAVIGKGQISGTEEYVEGYSLALYTTTETNYYGYIKNTSLSRLETVTYGAEKVTVLPSTALLSLPSFVRDEKNIDISSIKATADVEVLGSVNGYSASGASYLLVKVDGDDEQIGFIDITRARKRDAAKDKVITNAVVTKNNSEIFIKKDDTSDIITMLDKGARVRVIGSRDTKTNLTKISFNDKAGNQHTGYIYTYNLETDTWSMLQIIGMFLVIINTVLLVVIIVVKNNLLRK